MLKKTITYEDYNGATRCEDFYFNLTEAEVTTMELGTVGGLAEMIQRIVKAKDAPAIIEVFQDLIYKSYGEKSPDGKRFVKSKALSEAFSQTEAYSQLFMELATDAEEAAKFVNGIVPSKLSKNISPKNLERIKQMKDSDMANISEIMDMPADPQN